MSKNLTFKYEFDHYNRGEETITALMHYVEIDDGGNPDYKQHLHIREVHPELEVLTPNNVTNDYLVGPIVDRLHAFEEIGLEPEELKQLVNYYKKIDFERPEFLDKKFNVKGE